MKSQVLTKSMAARNAHQTIFINDPFRPHPRCQARFNKHPEPVTVMPPDSQLRWPVLFAVALCGFALAFLNFAMQM